MAPAIPRQQPISLEQILAPHVGVTMAGGSYRCTCLHTYEPINYLDKEGGAVKGADPDQRRIIDALHTQHQAERLLAHGVQQPRPADPRQQLRDRLNK